jgi:hypothetical protein
MHDVNRSDPREHTTRSDSPLYCHTHARVRIHVLTNAVTHDACARWIAVLTYRDAAFNGGGVRSRPQVCAGDRGQVRPRRHARIYPFIRSPNPSPSKRRRANEPHATNDEWGLNELRRRTATQTTWAGVTQITSQWTDVDAWHRARGVPIRHKRLLMCMITFNSAVRRRAGRIT